MPPILGVGMLSGILSILLAQATMPLPATGKWVLEGDNNMCALLRTFGEGGSQITFGIRRWPMGDHTDILVFAPDERDGHGGGAAQITFDGGAPSKAPYESYILAHKRVRLTTASYANGDIAPIESAKETDLAFGADATFRIALPDMRPALKALENCNDLLLRSLGVDPAWREKTAASPSPTEAPGHWFKEEDYPGSALMFGVQGMSRMLLTVGVDGRVTQCVTFGSSGNAKLDAAACKGFQLKGRFRPALSASGQPMIGYFVFSLDFRIRPPGH